MSLSWRLSCVIVATFVATACETAEPQSETADDQELVPKVAETLFDQAGVCDQIFNRHKAIRDQDLKDGVIRWACGDVNGVTGTDLGQEYCEYKATSGGRLVAKATDIKTGEKFSCVFTSVYRDCKGWDTPETGAYGNDLAKVLAAKDNLNVATADPKLTVMKLGANSRGAADALIRDCANNSSNAPKNEERQAACYEVALKNKSKISTMKTLCRSKDLKWLDDEARWKKVQAQGAKIAAPGDANYEWQRDLIACLRTGHDSIKGVPWRNSDPMICARTVRAAAECKATYSQIPTALDGFIFTGWKNRALPAGCRKAKKDGKDYDHMVICDLTTSEQSNLAFHAKANDLNEFCRTRFAQDVVMMAPIRAVTKSSEKATPFCSAYAGN
jgi:hypothetical protein